MIRHLCWCVVVGCCVRTFGTRCLVFGDTLFQIMDSQVCVSSIHSCFPSGVNESFSKGGWYNPLKLSKEWISTAIQLHENCPWSRTIGSEKSEQIVQNAETTKSGSVRRRRPKGAERELTFFSSVFESDFALNSCVQAFQAIVLSPHAR